MVALRKQRQVDNYKSKASLVYVASFRAASTGDVESNKTKQNKINNPQTNKPHRCGAYNKTFISSTCKNMIM